MIKPNLISHNNKNQNIKCVREVIGEVIVHTDYCYLPFISFSWGSIYTMLFENIVFDDVKLKSTTNKTLWNKNFLRFIFQLKLMSVPQV